jgi:hypothetical protein
MAEKDPQERQRQSVLELMLDIVRRDHYPSATHLDLIEQLLTDDDIDDYREVLFEKVADENYPSFSILNRLVRLGT